VIDKENEKEKNDINKKIKIKKQLDKAKLNNL
jgi:hypothetical protein